MVWKIVRKKTVKRHRKRSAQSMYVRLNIYVYDMVGYRIKF